MHIKYYIEPRLLNTEINTTAFWNIRFSIDADTAVVSQAAPLSPPVEIATRCFVKTGSQSFLLTLFLRYPVKSIRSVFLLLSKLKYSLSSFQFAFEK